METTIDQYLDGTWKLAVIDQDVYRDMTPPLSFAAVAACGTYCTGNAGVLPGTVPGNFEIDLQKAGVIPDPFFGKNLLDMLRYENCHVFYARKFDYTPVPDTKPELIFQGIDTIADIYLNGKFLARTDNMFIPHSFDADGLLPDENELVVHLLPVCIETRTNMVSAGNRQQRYNWEALRLRKSPAMFGWDICPRLVSAGLYRSVGIHRRPAASFKQFYLMTAGVDCKKNTTALEFFYQVDIGDQPVSGYHITVEGNCGDSNFSFTDRLWFTAGKGRIAVSNAAFWWPKGYGKANLYDVKVTLEKDGEVLDSYTTRFGIRTAALLRTGITRKINDGDFHFEINGKRIFIMGTNWVPVDAYHSRDRERIGEIMKLLEDIGCNAVRCWGGNLYEDPVFYEACDRMGIMVWQDFIMACGVYPIDAEFSEVMRNEARIIVRKLRQHPSIILWAGDNECDEGIAGGAFPRNPNGNIITRRVLPDLIAMEDPARPYLPSSPYIDEDAAKVPKAYLSESHLWGPRDYYKGDYYKNSLCHFASEMGYHGSVSVTSLKKFISPDKLWSWKDNDEWKVHSASPEPDDRGYYSYRIALMAKQIKELFGFVPDNPEDFVLASQISQAEAKKFFMELFRTGQPHRTGIIWWNLIDCWPQFSDAVVDYYYEKKLAYYYLRQSQKPFILAFKEPSSWKLPLTAVNNSGATREFTFTVKDYDTKERVLSGAALCEDQTALEIGNLPYSMGEKRLYLIEWDCGVPEFSGRNHYLAGNPPFDLHWYAGFLRGTYDIAAL